MEPAPKKKSSGIDGKHVFNCLRLKQSDTQAEEERLY